MSSQPLEGNADATHHPANQTPRPGRGMGTQIVRVTAWRCASRMCTEADTLQQVTHVQSIAQTCVSLMAIDNAIHTRKNTHQENNAIRALHAPPEMVGAPLAALFCGRVSLQKF